MFAHISSLPVAGVKPSTVNHASFVVARCCGQTSLEQRDDSPPAAPSFACDVLLPTSSTNTNKLGWINSYRD
jgi:hypothetical protein